MRHPDALAFADAVRDILASDGRFLFADPQRDSAIWEWDGRRWRRLPLVDDLAVAVAS